MSKSALVIDDAEISRITISTFLTVVGFSVDTAENGLMGLKYLSKKKYDLIFSDLEMPNVNGFEFLHMIKENPKLSNIPVVVLTSVLNNETEKRAKELGASCLITKPYNRTKMMMALDMAGFKYENNIHCTQ